MRLSRVPGEELPKRPNPWDRIFSHRNNRFSASFLPALRICNHIFKMILLGSKYSLSIQSRYERKKKTQGCVESSPGRRLQVRFWRYQMTITYRMNFGTFSKVPSLSDVVSGFVEVSRRLVKHSRFVDRPAI